MRAYWVIAYTVDNESKIALKPEIILASSREKAIQKIIQQYGEKWDLDSMVINAVPFDPLHPEIVTTDSTIRID